MADIKYPEVVVKLTGTDGNPFMVMGRVARALKKANVPPDDVKKFYEEATSGDYSHLLVTCVKWVTVR